MSGATRDWTPEAVYQEETLSPESWAITDVHTGELYQFTFSPSRLFFIPSDSIRKKIVEWMIDKKQHFEVEKSYINESTGDVVVTARVVDNPLPFLVAFGIIVSGSVLLLAALGLTLTKVTKLVESPAGAAAVGGAGLALVAGSLAAGYFLFAKGKVL